MHTYQHTLLVYNSCIFYFVAAATPSSTPVQQLCCGFTGVNVCYLAWVCVSSCLQ